MIEFIKEYGVSINDYENIIQNTRVDVIENIALSENSVREVLKYYNSLGITKNIAKIIIERPDLIIISKKNLENLLSKIDINLFKSKLENDIESLVVLGI